MSGFDEKYCLDQFRKLLAIDSTTGQYREIQDYVCGEIERLGFPMEVTHKGGVIADLGGEGNDLAVTAHLDDIGLMVRRINKDGTLNVCRVGGLYPFYCLMENVRVYTRDGQVYTGSVCRTPGSVHVTEEELRVDGPDYRKNICVVLDLPVKTAEDTRRLGIETGDMIALEPRFTMSGGYIKSRFVDDKACAAVLLAVMKTVKEQNLRLNRRVREINSQLTSGFNEGITGAKTTKTLVAESRMEEDFGKTSRSMFKTATKTSHFRSLFISTITFTSYIALALVLWRGGHITLQGLIELGTLAAFSNYALNLMEPIRWIVRAVSDLITVQVNIERFTRLMETESDVADSPEIIEKYGDAFHPKKENWEPLFGDIEFKDVSFMYPDGNEYVLEHFNLKVPQGTNVAIVGETGAGKSTLVNLVCRFFEPTSGQILIDGRDARERSQLWLHSNIGYVLQTPHLFSGTVKENLLYGKPDATMEQIEEAVKSVSADQVIARMDKGYDSDVGEGGDLLSTGEKQLLSFARAILANPRIFVLDEATSSIDTVTEKLIQDAIEHLMKGRTSFVIAHRLSTIRRADQILVVSGGKIVERGTHAELMAARGHYYSLYTRQYREDQLRSILD